MTHFEADPISQGTTFTQVAVNNHLPGACLKVQEDLQAPSRDTRAHRALEPATRLGTVPQGQCRDVGWS